jgi:hypothetical protein
MISKIETIEDVKLFANQILAEGVSFHPDDDFKDYINFKTKEPFYTIEEADIRNKLMETSFEVCEKLGVEIYEVMLEEIMINSLD